ncbi:MAG: hypothetical protein ACOX8S_07845 [Christensenellales bacterium]|jgi:hypothetical protein
MIIALYAAHYFIYKNKSPYVLILQSALLVISRALFEFITIQVFKMEISLEFANRNRTSGITAKQKICLATRRLALCCADKAVVQKKLLNLQLWRHLLAQL